MDTTFEVWFAGVNSYLMREIGLHSDDLPDWKYRMDYMENLSPKESALRAIQYAECY